VDTVHQGDWEGTKGVYHLNAVDAVAGLLNKLLRVHQEPLQRSEWFALLAIRASSCATRGHALRTVEKGETIPLHTGHLPRHGAERSIDLLLITKPVSSTSTDTLRPWNWRVSSVLPRAAAGPGFLSQAVSKKTAGY
jgi:hypothetical protein